MSLFSIFKKKKELKEGPEETFSRLINFLKNNKVWHGMRVNQKSETKAFELFVFTSQEEMQINQEWYAEPQLLTQSTFQELAELLREEKSIEHIVINPFHENCSVRRGYFLDAVQLPEFFDFPKDNTGILQVYEWLKEHPVLLFINDKDVIITNRFCIAHTDEASINHEPVGDEKYLLTDFNGIKKVFSEHPQLAELRINPNSDCISFNRIAFVEYESN